MIKSQTQDKMILDPPTNDNSDFIDKPESRVKNYVVNKILEFMYYFTLKTLLPILTYLDCFNVCQMSQCKLIKKYLYSSNCLHSFKVFLLLT